MINWIRKGKGLNGYVGYIDGKYTGWAIYGEGDAVGGWDVYRNGDFITNVRNLGTAKYYVLGVVTKESLNASV